MFNIRLKELRSKNGDTQASLAEKLGVSSRTVAAYEQGINEPSIDTLLQLSQYFNVTLDYLIGITNSKNPENRNFSDELHLSDEAIDILKGLTDVIAYESGTSLSDILNEMLVNPKFKKLLKSILTHVSRNKYDWDKFCEFLNSRFPDESTLSEAKRLSQATIADEFNSILSDLVNNSVFESSDE